MPHAYTEDQLLEQPAIGLFVELGWTTVSVLEESGCTQLELYLHHLVTKAIDR